MSKAEDFLKVSLEEANTLASTNKVLGSPICLDGGRMIIPYSSVKVCHLSGGSEYASKNSEALPFGGISGGNFQMEPRGFLLIENDDIKTISVEKSQFEKILLEDIPSLIKKLKQK